MAATTERSLRRLWMKSTRAEETDRMLGRLLSEGIWTNEIEANSWKAAGRKKWENRSKEGRNVLSKKCKDTVTFQFVELLKLAMFY